MEAMSSSFMFNRPPLKKLAVPARTYEEFLLSQNLDNWPRFPYMQEMDIRPSIVKLKNDYPLNTLTKYLHDNVPLVTETISNLEKKVQECKIKVDEHVKYAFALESGQSETDNQRLSVPEEVADTSILESHDIRRNKKVKIATDITQDTHCKTVENFKFPGFTLQKLTKLPNNLEPARLWDSVLKVQTFKGVNVKILKKLFLSEASLAILQDCFWWLFLHKFKPDEDEQDHFFDRISGSFVALLLSTPNYIKDPFFQMYPDCLSQTIYISFCEAFPESHKHFNDEFKEELMDLVFQWIRGFKPRKFAWKEWNIWLLGKPSKHSIQNDSFKKSSSFMKPLPQSQSSLFRHLSRTQRERRGHVKEGALGAVRFQLEREARKKKRQKTTKESHYIGDGPDFQRSLFNLGGHSPLVLYYLQMHGISNTLANSRAYRINHSEICKVPPVSPTYVDVIKESRMFIQDLHNDFIDFEHRCGEELAQLEEERRKMCKKYKRMMATITEKPTEARLKTEKFLNQVASAKPRQLKSSGATI